MKKVLLGMLLITLVTIGTHTSVNTQTAINIIQGLADGDTGWFIKDAGRLPTLRVAFFFI